MVCRREILIGGGAVALASVGASILGVRLMGNMEDYNASVVAVRAELTRTPEIREFIGHATLAASGHNTQPWQFASVGDVSTSFRT